MPVLLLTADLACSSKFAGAAARTGVPTESLMGVQRFLARAAETPVSLAILDLSTPGLDVANFVAALQSLPTPPAKIVAFGPHVHEAKLAAAQAAGCHAVMSRGQFHNQMDAILAGADN